MHPWPPPRCRPDRLSDLSDDVLTHILSFMPSKEAASTTALSRRWRRPLWLDTSVVNLDYRSHTTRNQEHNAFYFGHCDGRVIKKVAIVLHNKDIPSDALSSAVETGVQELRLECQHGGCPDYTYAAPSMSLDTSLSLDMLPLVSLRVLDLTGCKLSTYSPLDDYLFQPSYTSWDSYMYQPPDMSWPLENYEPPVSFHDNSSDSEGHSWEYPPLYYDDYHYKPASHWGPTYEYPPRPHIKFQFLEALRLRRCAINLETLQTMINDAPRLTNLRLESISILDECGGLPRVLLRCPSVVTLVMANLHNGTSIDGCHIELEAPRLQHLWYTQSMSADTSFLFDSPSPQLQRVHLGTHSVGSMLRCSMLAAISHIRFLKLTTYSMSDIAHDDLPVFPNLERLEIEELTCSSVLNHDITASAIANMLRKCPALRELRLKFSWREYLLQTVLDPVIGRAVMSDFEPCRSIKGGGNKDCHCKGLDLLPGLSCGCGLDYLWTSLRRFVLQFDVDELSCFQVRLLMFFSCFSVALEDVVVDGGLGYNSSCINRKIARCRRDAHRCALLKGDQVLCSSTRQPPAGHRPPFPPTQSDFPPLDVSLRQPYPAREVHDDDCDDDAEEDIFRRYLLHSGRKKKNGGSPVCFVVKPKATTKSLITTRRVRGHLKARGCC